MTKGERILSLKKKIEEQEEIIKALDKIIREKESEIKDSKELTKQALIDGGFLW